jgi:hypothetical protein
VYQLDYEERDGDEGHAYRDEGELQLRAPLHRLDLGGL